MKATSIVRGAAMLCALSILLWGCNGAQTPGDGGGGGSGMGSGTKADVKATVAPTKGERKESIVVAEKKEEGKPRVRLETSAGDIVLELDAEKAPQTVQNFLTYVRDGHYDGVVFHRVIKGFMIQGGCPQGTGRGNPGYRFADEINADALGLHTMKALDAQMKPHPWMGVRSQEDFNNTVLCPLFRS